MYEDEGNTVTSQIFLWYNQGKFSQFISNCRFQLKPGYETSQNDRIPHTKDWIWIRRIVIPDPERWFVLYRYVSKQIINFFGSLEVSGLGIISLRYLMCSKSLFLTTMYFSGTWPPSLPSTRPRVGSSLCIFTLSWCRTFTKRKRTSILRYYVTIPKYAVAKYKELKKSMPQNCAYHPNFLMKWKLRLGPGRWSCILS